jgi:nucleoside-diphosphate-sugar epimerase
MAQFTIIGAQGFIGSRLVAYLRRQDHQVAAIGRGEPIAPEPGNVIYCAGVTADFRSRAIDTVEAHVSHVAGVLRWLRPQSFLYLSSTRLYGNSGAGVETAPIAVRPEDPDQLYNATKLAGEALCLAQKQASVRVARLSNVYGPDMDSAAKPREDFLAAIVREAVTERKVTLRTALHSEKDYVDVEDVARALERIALNGRYRVYNVASGRNVTHAALIAALAEITGCETGVALGAKAVAYPPIATGRIAAEFTAKDPWRPASVIERLPDLVRALRAGQRQPVWGLAS